jgi:integrase
MVKIQQERQYLNKNLLIQFQDHWQGNLAPSTIQEYSYVLVKVPTGKKFLITKDTEKYLNANRKNAMLMNAWRKFIRFLYQIDKINQKDYNIHLANYYPEKRRGYVNTEQAGQAFPKSEWTELIRKAPNPCAKMGIWLGLQFGMRLAEILNLRVHDIDFTNQCIRVLHHKSDLENGVQEWNPKHKHDRRIAFNEKQAKTLKRWIDERPNDLIHPYLIWTPRNKSQVIHRTFQRWCKEANPRLKSHDLRRSFATNLYYASGKDLVVVQKALGHSNISTTSQYLRLEEETYLEKMRKALA